jgi:hypothetical protein
MVMGASFFERENHYPYLTVAEPTAVDKRFRNANGAARPLYAGATAFHIGWRRCGEPASLSFHHHENRTRVDIVVSER